MLLFLALVACSGGDGETADTAPPPAAGVVDLLTRDGVTLKADHYPASTDGRPGVVLIHMTPRGPWTRADWPSSFITRLTGHDWSVIAIDRRGAGESGGEPDDAFLGEAGRYDVEAAVAKLDEQSVAGLAILGASNGTTSMVDYAAWAAGEGLPEATVLGYLTGGTYTENQTAMEDVPLVPSAFTYSTEERAWSVEQQPLDPGTWAFFEYAEGAHGTAMFEAAPQVEEHLEGFIALHI